MQSCAQRKSASSWAKLSSRLYTKLSAPAFYALFALRERVGRVHWTFSNNLCANAFASFLHSASFPLESAACGWERKVAASVCSDFLAPYQISATSCFDLNLPTLGQQRLVSEGVFAWLRFSSGHLQQAHAQANLYSVKSHSKVVFLNVNLTPNAAWNCVADGMRSYYREDMRLVGERFCFGKGLSSAQYAVIELLHSQIASPTYVE